MADIDLIRPEPLAVGPGGIQIPTEGVTSRNVGGLSGGELKHEAFGGLLGEDYGSIPRGNPENLRTFDARRRHYESRYVVYQALASVIKNGGTCLWVWDARLGDLVQTTEAEYGVGLVGVFGRGYRYDAGPSSGSP